jgi:hypothetical protein
MCGDHTQIYTPASLVDPSGELVFLTNNIFTSVELTRMIEAATWLDANGKSTKRGIHKGGSRMVTFGIRYKYGKLAWYVLLLGLAIVLLLFYYCFTAVLLLFYSCLFLGLLFFTPWLALHSPECLIHDNCVGINILRENVINALKNW